MRIAPRSYVAVVAGSLGIAFASLPLPARAAGGSAHQEHTMRSPKSMSEFLSMSPEECMKMMDHKHKGHVTKEEFMKFQQQLWANMDKNRDNKVDASEWGGQAAPGGG